MNGTESLMISSFLRQNSLLVSARVTVDHTTHRSHAALTRDDAIFYNASPTCRKGSQRERARTSESSTHTPELA
jgi:hypothetical protein